ncbi:unnamed protein product [Cuscuta campestris]|uniref:Reverse transcriptase zinc-binding domain-containing protein n=1 Tax=Cuscuta campestris TaxID=132261 RepID=A0A484KFX4_9ASTE|nr:unnamed protein product [Cuscuta campestris]
MPKGKQYNVRDGYQWLQGERHTPSWKKIVWNKLTPPKFKFIAWLLMKGRIQTKARISKYTTVDLRCVLCGQGDEDDSHLFWECSSAQQILRKSGRKLNRDISVSNYPELEEFIKKLSTMKDRMQAIAQLVFMVFGG